MLANAVSVLDLFEKKMRLEVPLFQRQYVWNQVHQWAPLWDDIARKVTDRLTGRKDGPVHFLGAMVLDQKQTPTTHVDKRQVIDGQQRLTTLQLFLAALRDFCREQQCESLAQELGRFTKNDGKMADPATEAYKVWPTQRDRDQFRDVMDAGSRRSLEQKHPLVKLPRKHKYEPRPRMVDAYLFFHSQLSEFYLGTADEPALARERPLEDRLDDTLQALKAALMVVEIDLGPGDDAQVIFETLNARGEPLLPADLLRNYIFLRAARLGEEPEALYATYWKPFDEPFWRDAVRQGRLVRPRSDLFMQHYLSSRQFNEVPVTHLFVEYKYWIENTRPFANVASELGALAKAREAYRKFASSQAGTRLGAFGKFLDVFDVGTIHPLVLIIAESDPDDAELQLMLRWLESYIVRRSVCGLPTKAYNRVFLTLAAGLTRAGISGDNLRERLSALAGESSVWPTDAAFGEAFKSQAGYTTLNHGRVVYMLMRTFELLHSTKTERSAVGGELTVEHLMPQKWQDNWPLRDGTRGLTRMERWPLDPAAPGCAESADRDQILHTFGNLTLLTQALNASVSNGPWQTKRQEIAKYSILPMNQMAAAAEAWDEGAIRARADHLFSAALKLWPGPIVAPK